MSARRRRRPPATPAQLVLDAGAPPPERAAWTGPFQPALEAGWLDALAREAAGNRLRPVWLVVPSRFLGLHLKEVAARQGGLVNVHVLTFTDLAERLAGPAPGRLLPPVGDLLVLRQALREAVPDDGYFAAVREARRFPAALAATLAELRTAGVGPVALEATAAAADPTSHRKLGELARIMRCADQAVAAAAFRHPTDSLWTAAATVQAATAAPPCARLLVYGFVDWNAAERRLLAALAARLPTTCFVPADAGTPLETPGEPLAWLEAEGFRIARADAPPATGPRALAARLFRDPAPDGPGTAGLEVVAAPGEEREVREIARRILAAASTGVPFEAMGVLVRHPETYRIPIRDGLGAAGIPYTWGVAPRLGDTPAGRALRLLLAARREDFARGAVIEFLATAPLRNAEGAVPAAWDRLSREAGIVGGRREWRRGLGWLVRRATPPPGSDAGDDAPRPEPPAALVSLGRAVETLLETVGRLPERASAAALARGLLRAFRRLCRDDAEADQVATLLGSLEALAPLPTALGLDEFAELLDVALAAPAEPGPEPRRGRVFVGQLHQALGLPFRLLFIPGLVEQGFPAPPRGDTILRDDERQRLSAAGGLVPALRRGADRPAEERLAFRLAVGGAAERLVLSYPRVDLPSGRPRVPSFFLLRVAEAATGVAHDFSRFETRFAPLTRVPLAPAPPDGTGPLLDPREWLLAQATRVREADAAVRAACLAMAPRAARGRAALEARERSRWLTPWDGLLPDAARAVLAAHHRPTMAPVAATPLEAYAACPFRYYLGHVFGLAAPPEPERVAAITPRDRGTLLHAVLAAAYAAFRDAGLLPLTVGRLPEARPLLDAAFAAIEARFPATGLAPFWAGERARLLTDLGAALDAEAHEAGAWVPTAFEVAFGAGEDQPAVEHALPDGRVVRFRGRLDRLDLTADRTRARVIDYKGGKFRGGRGARLAAGTALQLPVYRLAAEALCRAWGVAARVDEAQYHYLTRRGGRRRAVFTHGDWEARRADFDRVLATILDGIAAGRFFQNPSAETCGPCDFTRACGTERERIEWADQKRGDAARAAYDRLAEIE